MSVFSTPHFTKQDLKILEKKEPYSGFCSIKHFKIQFPLFAGGMSEIFEREFLYRAHAVAVLLFDPDTNKVILIEQVRAAAFEEENPWLLEIVAGMIESNDTPEATAHREAIEEAGYPILSLIPIGSYLASPGISNEKTFVFCGRIKAKDIGELHGLAHEGEDIKVHVVPILDAFTLLEEGKILSASAIIALQWLQINRFSLRFPE